MMLMVGLGALCDWLRSPRRREIVDEDEKNTSIKGMEIAMGKTFHNKRKQEIKKMAVRASESEI
jgi:D-alanine-D-alanine ligase-like ATP-grasp enzyme